MFTMLIMIMFNVINVIPVYDAQEYNVITIKSNSVEWIYSSYTGINNIKRLMLYVDKFSLRYYLQSSVNRKGTPNLTKLSIVFIGNERVYYQFFYTINNVSLTIDSNIVVDERYVIVQWLNIETKVPKSQCNSKPSHRIVLPRTITLTCNDVDIPISINYASTKAIILDYTVFEELSMYDVSVERTLYYYYLEKCGQPEKSKAFVYYLNSTYIPTYASIEITLASNNDQENITISMYGLSMIDIDNVFKVLPSAVSIFDFVLMLAHRLELEMMCGGSIIFTEVDVVNKTLEIIRTYANDKLMFRNLVEVLKNKYGLLEPEIKVEVNQTLSNTVVCIEMRGRNFINISKNIVNQMLSESIKNLIKVFPSLSEIEGAVDQAQIVDMRYTYTNTPQSNYMQNMITTSVLVLAIAQVAALAGVITYILRHWRRTQKRLT